MVQISVLAWYGRLNSLENKIPSTPPFCKACKSALACASTSDRDSSLNGSPGSARMCSKATTGFSCPNSYFVQDIKDSPFYERVLRFLVYRIANGFCEVYSKKLDKYIKNYPYIT